MGVESSCDLSKGLDRGPGVIELTTTVIGDDDTSDFWVVSESDDRVLSCLDALEDNGHGGDAPDPSEVLPTERGIDEWAQCLGDARRLFCLFLVSFCVFSFLALSVASPCLLRGHNA